MPCCNDRASSNKQPQGDRAVLVVFDLLELDGEDLRPLSLLDRRDAVH